MNEAAPVVDGGSPAVPSEAPAPQATAPKTTAPNAPNWLIWLAIGAGAAVLALIGFLLGRRSGRGQVGDEEPEAEHPALTEAMPSQDGPVQARHAPEPAPPPAPAFTSRLDTTPFDIELVPQRMTLALINASLTYRLTILNRDTAALGPLRISCDLISAHASLQTAQQLEPDPEEAWMSHDFEALPPGEHLVVDGEVRLPRGEILPIRTGSSQLFVPLIRFTVQTLSSGTPETIGARVFVIGEEPDHEGAALRPFRLNDGTRSYSRIGQRAVTIAH